MGKKSQILNLYLKTRIGMHYLDEVAELTQLGITDHVHQVSGDAAVLFDPDSEESMRVAIERLLESDELRAEMIRRGYERIHHFSWDKCAAETAEIYKKICQTT